MISKIIDTATLSDNRGTRIPANIVDILKIEKGDLLSFIEKNDNIILIKGKLSKLKMLYLQLHIQHI
jgi:hypothetical protein